MMRLVSTRVRRIRILAVLAVNGPQTVREIWRAMADTEHASTLRTVRNDLSAMNVVAMGGQRVYRRCFGPLHNQDVWSVSPSIHAPPDRYRGEPEVYREPEPPRRQPPKHAPHDFVGHRRLDILDTLIKRGPSTMREVCDWTGLPSANARSSMGGLMVNRLVSKSKPRPPKYNITPHGRERYGADIKAGAVPGVSMTDVWRLKGER